MAAALMGMGPPPRRSHPDLGSSKDMKMGAVQVVPPLTGKLPPMGTPLQLSMVAIAMDIISLIILGISIITAQNFVMIHVKLKIFLFHILIGAYI
jgi:hypothetical protein